MKIAGDNIGQMPLDEFVRAVAGIYSAQDEKRSIWDIWLHAVHHAASIGEEARKYKPGEKLLWEIADFSMWLFTFVSKINGPFGSTADGQRIEESTIRTEMIFSDLIWNKYPGICPVCFGRRMNHNIEMSSDKLTKPCDCLLHPVETRSQSQIRTHVSKLRRYAKEQLGNKPMSVDRWQQMFQDIYETNLRHLNLTDIAFHLLEEVGEVSDAMVRMYTYDIEGFQAGEPSWRQISLENEIADVSSWLFTLVNHLQLIPEIAIVFQKFVFRYTVLKETKITLSGIIWRRYGSDDIGSLYCPHACKKQICSCPILLVRDESSLARLRAYAIDVLT